MNIVRQIRVSCDMVNEYDIKLCFIIMSAYVILIIKNYYEHFASNDIYYSLL